MANRIPESFISEVRQKVNIVDVIGKYTTLVKRGRQWSGSCPFHDDRHPSLFVEENKQVFNCFSCGRSGSVFSFVMEKEGLTYPESIISLAKEAGIPIDNQLVNDATKQINPRTQAIYDLHDAAQRLYQHILTNTTSGEPALKYLREKRKLSDNIIKRFGIGYVPAENVLLHYAQEHNISREVMIASELFIESESGDLRDRFTNRVVWPIRTVNGQVVGFSGRTLDVNNSIKYMNSPESTFFNKGNLLYNFDQAKNSIRRTRTVLIFEGFMDVIASDMSGYANAVATMGTALTLYHVKQLTRLVDRVLLVYDGDEAGQEAAKRSIDLIKKDNPAIDIGIIHLPDQLDPDEVRVQRGEQFLKQVLEQNVLTPVTFLIDAAKGNKNLSNQTQYLNFLQEVMPILKNATPVEQDIQLTNIANEFGTSKQALIEQLQQTPKANIQPVKNQTRNFSNNDNNLVSNSELDYRRFNSVPTVTQVERAERALIMAMIKKPQVIQQVEEKVGFAFVHSDYQLLMMLINIYHQQHREPFDLAAFMDFIQKPELNQKIMAIERAYGELSVENSAIDDYIKIIAHDGPIDNKITQLKQSINIAKQQHDNEKLLQLTTELINLKKQNSI
ncbi:DNA primase [Leuconostoc palmae]|uniref:DNA primase n=1 Tax=Leuconostoc palmae TaxID=501487 RepID=UPI001C7D39C6|nr:DNA primase [Leuconostoc palmae]